MLLPRDPLASIMEINTRSITYLVVIGVAAGILLLLRALRAPPDPNEPPYILPEIPYIGHLLGLLRTKIRYYTSVNAKYQYPIFTLPILTGKIYVVNSLNLISEIQRHPKTFSFWYLEALFGNRLAAVSDEGARTLLDNAHPDYGEDSMFVEAMRFLARTLRPGEPLDDMSRVMAHTICASLDRFDISLKSRQSIDLYEWIKHEMTMATTESVYGPLNPFRDPSVESGFWDFSQNIAPLLLGFLPSIFARKGYNGRKKVTDALEHYFATGAQAHASAMERGRYEIVSRHGIHGQDLARFEAVQCLAILTNTIPSAFWALFHTLSQPALLPTVRARAAEVLTQSHTAGATTRTLHLGKLRTDPLFASLFQEALRCHSFGAASRIVMHDAPLDSGRYRLRKGTLLLMPDEAVHSDASLWNSPRAFDAARFVPGDGGGGGGGGGEKTLPKGAFRVFGGGVNICPGRFFAATEVLFVVAMVALRYDIVPVAGEWCAPELDLWNMAPVVTPPKGKVPVWVSKREGWEDGVWTFEV